MNLTQQQNQIKHRIDVILTACKLDKTTSVSFDSGTGMLYVNYDTSNKYVSNAGTTTNVSPQTVLSAIEAVILDILTEATGSTQGFYVIGSAPYRMEYREYGH